MNITDTDRKYIAKLFERKPDATGKDVMVLIERLNKTDMRKQVSWLIDKCIEDIVRGLR